MSDTILKGRMPSAIDPADREFWSAGTGEGSAEESQHTGAPVTPEAAS